MIDYSGSILEKLSVHGVGTKTFPDFNLISKESATINDSQLSQLLLKFFFSGINSPEKFYFNDQVNNEVFRLIQSFFRDDLNFHEVSVSILNLLFEASENPSIKTGELYVSHITNISFEGVCTDAIGIFKSESKTEFVVTEIDSKKSGLSYHEGIIPENLDKGCLIFNLEEENGYRVKLSGRSVKSAESQFWKEDFLHLSPVINEFHHTKQYMDVARTFVNSQITEEFEVSKAGQAQLMNRSYDYFKKNDAFEEKEFVDQVFQDPQVISSFNNYKKSYEDDHDLEIPDEFDIHPTAVKNQSKVFKSILKLDRNFHIYIHGDHNLIEKGQESDGRKYYKVYFTEET